VGHNVVMVDRGMAKTTTASIRRILRSSLVRRSLMAGLGIRQQDRENQPEVALLTVTVMPAGPSR
jgi:hypothetical protein